MTPRFWILAGPNGSGKSTFARSQIFSRLTSTPEESGELQRVNPDEIARRLESAEPTLAADQRALKAAQRSDAEVDALIDAGRSFLVETVLSSDKFFARIERARARDYWVGLVFVLLRDPELNVGRVAQRAASGGHDVPADRIRARWLRSLERLPIVARLASAWTVWDNSFWGGAPELLAEQVGPAPFVTPLGAALMEDDTTHPALRAALRAVVYAR